MKTWAEVKAIFRDHIRFRQYARESGQVECLIPHHPRRDGEPCGSCRAVL